MSARLERIRQRLASPELWLLGTSLLARLLGFVASLLVSRVLGVASLGVYSSVLITAVSPTTPMSAVMANNATMLAARVKGRHQMRGLLAPHLVGAVGCAVVALAGSAVMLWWSGLGQTALLPAWALWAGVVGLVFGQLLTQIATGLCHGLDRSRTASAVTAAVTLVALLSIGPVLWWLGLEGVILQAMLVMLLPGVLLTMWLRWGYAQPDDSESAPVAAGQVGGLFWKALPNMGATVVNNATNWMCCVLLVRQFHGEVGLGLVAIGLQWMALMLLPTTSWGGRVMRALTLAHEHGPAALKHEAVRQARRCAGVSAAAGGVVVVVAPWISDLYRADSGVLFDLFLINAVAATLAGANFVFERVYFCLGNQRPWLRISLVAYAAQLGLTWCWIPHSVLAVALGNLLAIAVVLGLVGRDLHARLGGKG